MTRTRDIRPRPRARWGFTILEVVFALFIFAGMALIFAAVFPMASQSAKANGYYAAAAGLTQHKMEQLRAAGYSTLQSPSLLAARGIVDAGSPPASVPYTASFTQVDQLTGVGDTGLFPPGATGTFNVRDYSTLNPAVPVGTVDTVTITIHWQNGSASPASWSTSSLIIQMPHT
jgi:type II secretory pathway pseudopilin PulG